MHHLFEIAGCAIDTEIDELTKWVLDNGGIIGPLEIKRDKQTGERGAFTVREIDKGDEIIRLPQKLLITSDLAENSEVRYAAIVAKTYQDCPPCCHFKYTFY